MKMSTHFDFDTLPVSFRKAWLMSRACTPTKLSPMSPSSSARGTSAATESTTMMSRALLITSSSAICSASSALPGWLTSNSSMLTPSFLHQEGSRACSASMNAAIPLLPSASRMRWALATACRAIVVLPLDSGPNSSMIRPRGRPLPPSDRSSDRAPVEIPSTSRWLPSPSFMIAPAPKAFSIWLSVLLSAFCSAEGAGLASAAAPLCFLATAKPSPHPQSGTSVHSTSKSSMKGGGESSSPAGFPPLQRGPGQGRVFGAVGLEGRGEGDDLADLHLAEGCVGILADQAGQIRRRAAARLDPSEGDVGVETLGVGGEAGASEAGHEAPLQGGQGLDPRPGRAGPDDPRPRRVGEGAQAAEFDRERAGRLGRLRDGPADSGEVGIRHVAEEGESK